MDKKKKTLFALFLNLLFTFWAFYILLNSNELWRIICASIGFIGFFLFCVLLVLQLRKISGYEK